MRNVEALKRSFSNYVPVPIAAEDARQSTDHHAVRRPALGFLRLRGSDFVTVPTIACRCAASASGGWPSRDDPPRAFPPRGSTARPSPPSRSARCDADVCDTRLHGRTGSDQGLFGTSSFPELVLPAAQTLAALLAHGFGDHTGRWQRYGERLARLGGAVFACDHRGHGLSHGERVLIDIGFDYAATDLLAVRDTADFPRGVPVLLHGHWDRWGRLVATRAAMIACRSITALVASSSRLGPWDVAAQVLDAAP